jgi:2-aminoethylphosphonate-pyruvate transaminase
VTLGVEARAARYGGNHEILTRGMSELGFEAYLAPEDQSYIITTYRYPNHPRSVSRSSISVWPVEDS